MEDLAIGIDLGTTQSCVSVLQNEKVEIIFNRTTGFRTTPSMVAFTEKEIYVGNAAKVQQIKNHENTVFEIKRLIGRKIEDEISRKDIMNWPFAVEHVDRKPHVKVCYRGKMELFSPEIISSIILLKLKEIAESFLGCPVSNAVITVPAYFNDSQRQATKDAGEMAGLKVLKIINEPTAAAIAYIHKKTIKENQNILVFDFGGGTFDVSIVSFRNKNVNVLAVGGDANLGGVDIDNILVRYCLLVIRNKYGKDLSTKPGIRARLKKSCENAKKELSELRSTSILFDFLGVDHEDADVTITRTEFNELCKDIFAKCIHIMIDVIYNSSISKTEIDEVIMVGGSTRIPKVQELVREYFDNKSLNMTIHPEEAVAFGAAYEAHSKTSSLISEIDDINDIIPKTLSTSDINKKITKIIPRYAKIPTERTVGRVSTTDFQTKARFTIYEGESENVDENTLLGIFWLTNIKQGKAGEAKFNLTYRVDRDGILHASAVDRETKERNEIEIVTHKGRLTKNEKDDIILKLSQMEII